MDQFEMSKSSLLTSQVMGTMGLPTGSLTGQKHCMQIKVTSISRC